MLKREPVCQSAFTISNMEDKEKARKFKMFSKKMHFLRKLEMMHGSNVY